MPAVLLRRGARTRDDRGEHHRHVLLVVAGVPAGDVAAIGMAPGGGNLRGHGLLEGEPDGICQRFHGGRRAVHVRRGLLGIAERALGSEIDRHATVEPFVVGRRQLGEHHQAQIDARVRIALVGVDEIGHLRRAGDGDVAGIVLDGDGGLDLEIAEAVARILQDRDTLVGAVGHLADERAHLAVCHGEQLVDAGVHLLLAILGDHGVQVALTHLAGADEGVEVALLVPARAHVGEQQVQNIVAGLALVPDLHRRDAQALVEDVLGVGVVPRRHWATDVC